MKCFDLKNNRGIGGGGFVLILSGMLLAMVLGIFLYKQRLNSTAVTEPSPGTLPVEAIVTPPVPIPIPAESSVKCTIENDKNCTKVEGSKP